MTTQDAIKKGILFLKGQPIEIGKLVAHESDPIAYELKGFINSDAVCHNPRTRVTRRFPQSEIFELGRLAKISKNIYLWGGFGEGLGKDLP